MWSTGKGRAAFRTIASPDGRAVIDQGLVTFTA
jgi:hypothetical protein